jgi:hypothetical protein
MYKLKYEKCKHHSNQIKQNNIQLITSFYNTKAYLAVKWATTKNHFFSI